MISLAGKEACVSGGAEDKYGKIIHEIIVRKDVIGGAGRVPAPYIFKRRRK